MVLECLIYNEKIRISLDIWFFGIILIEFVIEEDVWLVLYIVGFLKEFWVFIVSG